MQHQAAEHLGVGHDDHGRDRRRRRGAGAGRRRVHERDLELGADHQLAQGVLVVRERRRGHGVDGEALGLAAQRRHLTHARQHEAVARRHQERLARAADHGLHLGQVVDRLRHVLGQPHRHHEVDVGQLLAEGRHALHVGLARAATLVRVRVAHVEHVGAGAEVAVAVLELERRRVAATRLEQPGARRGLERARHHLPRHTHARAVHLRAGLAQHLEGRRVAHLHPGLGQQPERGCVHRGALVLIPYDEASSAHAALPSHRVPAGRSLYQLGLPCRVPTHGGRGRGACGAPPPPAHTRARRPRRPGVPRAAARRRVRRTSGSRG